MMWKEIPGHPNYLASEEGNILSIRNRKYLKTFCDRGYLKLRLGEGEKFWVHRIVAKTFLPNPLNKPAVNHKNGIRSDNRASNLEWVTPMENAAHAKLSGVYIGENNGFAKLSEAKVRKIKWLLSLGTQRKTIARKMRLKYGNVTDIALKRTWAHVECPNFRMSLRERAYWKMGQSRRGR